jgi:hypothetical protein
MGPPSASAICRGCSQGSSAEVGLSRCRLG